MTYFPQDLTPLAVEQERSPASEVLGYRKSCLSLVHSPRRVDFAFLG